MTAAKRTYSLEDFARLMSRNVQALERRPEARQRYAGLLAVLRQQVDSYCSKQIGGK